MLREKVKLTALLVAPVAEDVIAGIGGERAKLPRLKVGPHAAFPIGEEAASDENLNDLLIAGRKEFLNGAAPFGPLETHIATLSLAKGIFSPSADFKAEGLFAIIRLMPFFGSWEGFEIFLRRHEEAAQDQREVETRRYLLEMDTVIASFLCKTQWYTSTNSLKGTCSQFFR